MASWKDRIVEAAIETPDKKRYVFGYRDFSKDIDKKTSRYRFGDVEGTLVQDFGLGEVSIPMIIYFEGANYDRQADDFEKSASKKGVCILEHPIYGVKNIVIEKIGRSDALATAANQAVFTLTITETILFKVPVVAEDNQIGILAAIENLKAKISSAYNNSFLGKTESAISKAADRIENAVNEISDSFAVIESSVDEITSKIYSTQRYINRNLDTLLNAPLSLAESIQNLISAPARATASVKQRISIYSGLYSDLAKNVSGKNSNDKKNRCAEKQLLLPAIASAMCEAAIYPDTDGIGFRIRSEATAMALDLFNFYIELQEYLDQLQSDTEDDNLINRFVVSDEMIQALKAVMSLTVKNLVRLSFILEQERTLLLTADRNIIDLCYELYGTSDNDHLDLLMDSNGLTGDNIIMVPSGTEIRYYA